MPAIKDKPEFQLLFIPDGPCDRDEAYRRLKALLKAALRSYGMRCKAVQQVGVGIVTPEGIERLENRANEST